MMPKIKVRPAAIRNSMTPNWTPFSTCSTIWIIGKEAPHPPVAAASGPPSPAMRERDSAGAAGIPLSCTAGEGGERGETREGATRLQASTRWSPIRRLLHLAFGGVGIGVIGEHHLLDLAHVSAVGVLGDAQEVEILDRKVVGIIFEGSTHRGEVGLGQRGDHAVL